MKSHAHTGWSGGRGYLRRGRRIRDERLVSVPPPGGRTVRGVGVMKDKELNLEEGVGVMKDKR